MTCKYHDKLKDYLDEKLSPDEMQLIEGHIDNCPICQQELDILLQEPLKIPDPPLDVDDNTLIAKIKARRKGITRITCYGILGFLLGVFSRFYTRDDFLLTKALMALPYKLAEFALAIFFSGNKLTWQEQVEYSYMGGIGFFPFHPIMDFLAGIITPAIIASFIAIMIGYLISDKRVFRRKKIINFFAAGLLIFCIWTIALYGLYSNTLTKIDHLEGINGITIYEVTANSTSWLMSIDKEALSKKEYADLITGLSRSPKIEKAFPREETDLDLLIHFSGGGRMLTHLDLESGIMAMLNRNYYQISLETIEQIRTLIGGKNHE